MEKLRVSSLHWSLGVFFTIIGALMLIAPHQFGFLAGTLLYGRLMPVGLILLLTGFALFTLAVTSPPRWFAYFLHLWAAALLFGLALSFIGTGDWVGPLNYSVLGFAMAFSMFSERSWKRHTPPAEGDLFPFFTGIGAVLTGIVLLVSNIDPVENPIYYLSPTVDAAFGLLFLLSGAILIYTEIAGLSSADRIWNPFRKRLLPGIHWAGHLLTGGAFIGFLILTVFPDHLWIAVAYYGSFGLILLFLPWLAPRLERFPPTMLRTRLSVVLASAAIIPLILTVSIAGHSQEDVVRDQALVNQESAALSLAHTVDDYVNLHRASLEAITQQPGFGSMPVDEQELVLKGFAQSFPEASSFTFFDRLGEAIVSVGAQPLKASFAGYPIFKQTYKTKKTSYDILAPPLLPEPMLGIAHPVEDMNGEFVGEIVLALPIKNILALIEEQSSNPDYLEYIVDGNGSVVAHPDLSLVTDLDNFALWPPVMAAQSTSNPTGSLVFPTIDGARLAGFARIPGLDWWIFVEHPEQEALAGVYAGRDLSFAAVLVFLVLAVCSGILLAGRLTAPLSALARAARELAAGNSTVPLPRSGYFEAQQLSAIFGDMRVRLANRTAERERALRELKQAKLELEERVVERTTELRCANEQLVTVNEELTQLNLELEHELEEREKMEERLAYQALLLENVHDAVIATDIHGRITAWNQAAERMYGWQVKEVLGKVALETVPFDINADQRQQISRGLREKGAYNLESVQHARDGRRIFSEATIVGLRDENDQLFGYVIAIRDISDRKQTEDAVRAYAHQLEISNKDLEDFAFIVSHDLQEPLRKIQAFGKLLVEQKTYRLGNTAQDYITRMSDAATRMKSMLDDLLNYSRVSTRGQPFSRVSLNKIAEEVLGDLEVRVLETGGSVEVGELPTIEADPMQMRQLIQNLVSNALKFHKPGIRPEVIVCAEWEDGDKSDPNTRVRLIVEDNGIGFEPQFKERIFQPFQRLHGRKEYEGSGIGLAICRKIVERHGGVIEAFGQPGEGAKFIVDLPASQRREAEAIS